MNGSYEAGKRIMEILKEYFENLIYKVEVKISADIQAQAIGSTVSNAFQYHLENNLSFLKFYFRIIKDYQYFLSTGDFFANFKKQYSLQGMDFGYIDWLDQREQKRKHAPAPRE